MKKILFIIAFATALSGYAQVGIGTSNPDISAQLDVVSTNKGMLIPRVKLTGSSDQATVASPKESLLVYNTETVSDVIPGFYYWNSFKWVALSGGGLSGTVGIANGGTGAVTAVDALVSLGAQSVVNRSMVITEQPNNDTYPSVNAVKTYVDAETKRAIDVEIALGNTLGLKAATADVTAAVLVESERATGVEEALQTAIDAEKNRALVVEGQLTSSLDAVGTSLSDFNIALTAKASAVDMNAKASDVDLVAEKDRAMAAEGLLQDGITAKASAGDIDAAVLVEKNRAMTVEGNLLDGLGARDAVIATKELLVNKSTVIGTLVDDTAYPSTKAVKTYVDAAVSTEKNRAEAAETVLTTALAGKADKFGYKEITADYTLSATDDVLFIPPSVSVGFKIKMNDASGNNVSEHGRMIKIVNASAAILLYVDMGASVSGVTAMDPATSQVAVGIYTSNGWMFYNTINM
jgi:hypothetical protein